MYPHPLDGRTGPLLTAHERILRRFSATVRDKNDWTTKILDKALFAKWIDEAEKQDHKLRGWKVALWDAENIRFVYGELINAYKPFVENMKEEGSCIEPDIDGVWRTDSLVDSALRDELLDAVATLENVPDDQKDWHPGSKNQVLDLVHPSLWPLIYGKSTHIETGNPICGYGPQDYEPVVKPKPKPRLSISDLVNGPGEASVKAETEERVYRPEESYSQNFCWLPSEFEVLPNGETKIRSYINNLSLPEQKKRFYPLIEKVFSRFVPLFNLVLADLKSRKQHHKRVSEPDILQEDDIYDSGTLSPEEYAGLWKNILEEFSNGQDISVTLHGAHSEDNRLDMTNEDFDAEGSVASESSEEDDDDESEKYLLWDVGPIIPNSEWSPPPIPQTTRLEGKTIKVIVKMANIHLTPENPKYGGGSWHVEAMMNERIVATGIYYYDQENVTDSRLAFARTVYVPSFVDEYSHTNWNCLYEMTTGWDNAVQGLGGVTTKTNRAIAFPNIFQHQVQPFGLVDPTKPGYRKILVFFLCDPEAPENEIPSTRMVAPQQPVFRKDFEDTLRGGQLGTLPEEVFSMVMESLPPPVSLDEAKAYREDLMDERRAFNKNNDLVRGREYSLCEH
ncbi:hypothetical protein TWF481_008288 [Arthrobotrys musiformis]|uniref:Uncharacterized protein n=1 Tax=Arthrobotrys musiformis TaxID=47236 RepID=A0AAV9W8T5_9PEZI